MWKKHKNNKGFTLVELIVTIALTGVFMVTAIGVLVSFMQIQNRVTHMSKVQMVSDLLTQTIISEVGAAYQRDGEQAVMIHNDAQGISFWNREGIPLVIQADERGYLMEMNVQGRERERWYEKEHYMGTVITQLNFKQMQTDNAPSNKIQLILQVTHTSSGVSFTTKKIFPCYNLTGVDIGS